MLLADAIADYKAFRSTGDGAVRKETQANDADTLRLFTTYLPDDAEIESLTSKEGSGFLEWLATEPGRNGKPRAGSTVNQHRTRLQSFVNWAVEEGLLKANILYRTRRRPEIEPRRPALPQSEWVPTIERAAKKGPMVRCAQAVHIYTGLRDIDRQRLRLDSVDLVNDELHVIGKGDKRRTVPLFAEMREEFELYLPWLTEKLERESLGCTRRNPGEVYLFPAGRSGFTPYTRFDPYNPRPSLRNDLEAGGHEARRAFLREMHRRAEEAGQDGLRVAQFLAGHSSQKTTEIYLGVSHAAGVAGDLMKGQRLTPAPAPALRAVENAS